MADLLEIIDDEEDAEFLSQLEAAEAKALSLFSSSKRRRINPGCFDMKLEKSVEEIEEGAYTAALRGSKSLAWKKQSQVHATKTHEPAQRAVALGGACYKCGNEGHWAKDCGQSSEPGAEKSCPCGLGNCLVLTANTERNRGRKFFRCPLRQENGGCGFFEWCDDSSGNCTSAEVESAWKNGGQQQFYHRPAYQGTSDFIQSRNEYDGVTNSMSASYGAFQKFEATDHKGYGMKTGSSCFKCGKEGHWARDCPASPSSNFTATSASVKGKSSSANTCFQCGQSGHWAKVCSQTLISKPQNW